MCSPEPCREQGFCGGFFVAVSFTPSPWLSLKEEASSRLEHGPAENSGAVL